MYAGGPYLSSGGKYRNLTPISTSGLSRSSPSERSARYRLAYKKKKKTKPKKKPHGRNDMTAHISLEHKTESARA